MGLYLYQHPETLEVVEIVQSMNDKHEFIKDNIKYNRIFTSPLTAIDTRCDPYNPKDFVKVTNKKGTIGSLWDRSAELSEKRKGSSKEDPIKEMAYKNYAKKCGNKPHPDIIKRNAREKLDKMGVIVES